MVLHFFICNVNGTQLHFVENGNDLNNHFYHYFMISSIAKVNVRWCQKCRRCRKWSVISEMRRSSIEKEI